MRHVSDVKSAPTASQIKVLAITNKLKLCPAQRPPFGCRFARSAAYRRSVHRNRAMPAVIQGSRLNPVTFMRFPGSSGSRVPAFLDKYRLKLKVFWAFCFWIAWAASLVR
jgi:hypothetical protein